MALYPGATFKPVASHGSALTAHLGLVLHVQQGFGSLHGWFSDPAVQASAHFWVGATGAVEQYIDTNLQSWAQAAGNGSYCSVETEGFGISYGSNPATPLTAAQVEALVKLYEWGHHTHGWALQEANKAGALGFGVHYMGGASWGGHPCPGPVRAAQRATVLRLVNPPAPKPPPIAPKDDEMTVLFAHINGIDGRPASAAWADAGTARRHVGASEYHTRLNSGEKIVIAPLDPADGFWLLPVVGAP